MIKEVEGKTIYELIVHEKLRIDKHNFVTRVPGGWIYSIEKPISNIVSQVFVPFDNEFQLPKNEILND